MGDVRDLDGKVTIVTGAASGIGHAIASLFAANGAAVTVNYLGDGDAAHDLAGRIKAGGGRSFAFEADVSDAAAVERLVGATVEQFGRLDVLVNNAGIERSQPLLEITQESWERTLAVDLTGPFLCLRAAARHMCRDGGSIVNVSSIHEDVPFPGFTPYAAAKAACAC